MKTLLRILVGSCLIACVASATAALSSVEFAFGRQEFKAGDAIVIDQVLADSPRLEVGAKVVVRGRYQLASAGKARLGLFVTHPGPAGRDPVAPSQIVAVDNTHGAFELSCEITYPGDLHVSFYPATAGASFGGVYFSSAPDKS